MTTQAERSLLFRLNSVLGELDTFRTELSEHFGLRPLMNKSEAAGWLGIARATLDKGIERGQIPTVTFGESEWIAFADLLRLVRVRVED